MYIHTDIHTRNIIDGTHENLPDNLSSIIFFHVLSLPMQWPNKELISKSPSTPSKLFSAIQSYSSRISVGLLSYDSRSTLIRLDQLKNGRVCREDSLHNPTRGLWKVENPEKQNDVYYNKTEPHIAQQWTTRPKICNPIVLESICYCTTANWLINKSNTTRWQKKIGREALHRSSSMVYVQNWTRFTESYNISILFCLLFLPVQTFSAIQ